MGLFDRFKGKKDPGPAAKPPTAHTGSLAATTDTKAVILLGEDIGLTAVSRAVEDRFGPQALLS